MGDTASCVCNSDRTPQYKDDAAAGMDSVMADTRSNSPRGKLNRHRADLAPRPTPRTPRPGETLAQRVARLNLGKVCADDDADDVAIQRALADGKAAGLAAFELAEATELATRTARRRKAREALAAAMSSREEEALRRALFLADEAALDGREVEGALALIEELEGHAVGGVAATHRAKAVLRLELAIKSRGQQELEEAIEEAESTGLGVKSQRALLAEARVTLKMVNARRQAAQDRRRRELISEES
mmetsp:Transcript_29265/g.97221  ORF Transcript_29265/g.97221 Transcript_29265/m.97221 type:complete len:246 (-) Transcript_29265:209-946(-)